MLLPLALVAALLLLVLAAEKRGLLERRTAPAVESAYWIEPAGLVGEEWGSDTDPRWGDELRHALGKLPAFRVDDPLGAPVLRRTIESLSFVAAVDELEITDAGVAIALRLREPVACIPVRRGFQMVDAEGILLTGIWPSPARWDGVPLPVLGPLSDGEELFADASAGDWLGEPEHVDALDVALSMREHLNADQRRALGRIVIDATQARRVSVSEPGVRLELENRRLVLFGRAPSTEEPGELAPAHKWASLGLALRRAEEDPVGMAWDLVDVRWDRPDIVLRHPRLALAEEPAPPSERGRPRAVSYASFATPERARSRVR